MTRTGQHQRCISAIHWLEASATLALGAIFVTALIGTAAAQAQTYTVLHSFKGAPTDGRHPPSGHLIGDSAGNLYGTTEGGGASGFGVVFKLDMTGTETVLYSFTGGADGSNPFAGLIRDSAGNLYGSTEQGGDASGFGVVFKLDTTGTETVLHSFTGGADGAHPYAGLIRDSAGNFYGTTKDGGASDAGVVFKLDTTGTETVLHSFRGGDGAYSRAGVIRDSAGNLYGTTCFGGASGAGVVFKLDATGETVLYSFTGGADGGYPEAGLLRDSAGNLYGTASGGGLTNCGGGCGVVFKVDTTGTETVLYSFTGGADGSEPEAGVIQDPAGNLYGTTYFGGDGVVFELDTTGTETVLYSFTGGADGSEPEAGVIQDPAGNLYGTTRQGGTSGNGVVFKIQP
jgi:uncharacterized repeat protein (TIGR03803 family)